MAELAKNVLGWLQRMVERDPDAEVAVDEGGLTR